MNRESLTPPRSIAAKCCVASARASAWWRWPGCFTTNSARSRLRRRLVDRSVGRQSARRAPAAIRRPGQARHFPVHVRRAVARRYVRPQAAAGPRQRQTAAVCEAEAACAPRPAICSASPFKFTNTARSGIEVSDLFPELGGCIDDICVIRSMVADNINHNGACLQMNTGEQAFSRPSLGSWLLYGLGSENQNLPGYRRHQPRPAGPGRPAVEFQLSAGRLSGHARLRFEKSDRQSEKSAIFPEAQQRPTRRAQATQRIASATSARRTPI